MTKRTVIITTVVLLAYFAFTSGAVYELTGSEDTNRLVTPYNIALSGERTGLVALFSPDDLDGAKWLQDGQDRALLVVCDGNIGLLLRGYQMANTAQMVYFSGAFSDQPHYLFLSTWNVESGKIVSGARSAGMREISRVPDIDLTRYDEVFRSGKTVIYERRLE